MSAEASDPKDEPALPHCVFCGGTVEPIYYVDNGKPYHLSPLWCLAFLRDRIDALERIKEATS